MKKQIIILVVCIVVAGALGTALWFLLGYEPAGEGESSSVPSTATQLVEKTDYDLDTIRVQNETDAFVIKNLGDGKYALEGIEDVPLSSSMLKSVANCGVSLRTDSTVNEDAAQLSDFGLDVPRVTFTAKYTDGSSFDFELGKDAPAGSGIYGRKPGESTVYLLSSYTLGNLFNNKLDFIDKVVTQEPESARQAAAQGQAQGVLPEKITLGGSLRPEEIVIQKSETASEEEKTYNLNLYEMTAPKKRGVDSEQGTTALSGMLAITAAEIASYRPDAAQLVEYGLQTPYSTVRFVYLDDDKSEKQVALSAGIRDADGNVYLMREGVPLVYKVPSSSLPWYEMEYQDFLASLQLLPFIDDVKKMTITGGGKETVFLLEGESDVLKVTSDGKTMDNDQFRKYYQNLIGIPSEEFTQDMPPAEDTALIRITYEYRDANRPADTMALLPSQQPRRLFISINGEAEFYTKSSYLDLIQSNLTKLLAGETVSDLY